MARSRLPPALPERGRSAPPADRRRGGRAGQADRARRPRREGAHGQLEPAPRGLDREALPGPAHLAARPDPGGHPRPDPRRREVRLAPRLQVLDLRDLVDPPGDRARHREQGAHDPHARSTSSSASARSAARSTTLAAELGRQPTDEELAAEASCRSSRCARCARPRARSRASTGRSARTRTRRSASLFAERRRRPGRGDRDAACASESVRRAVVRAARRRAGGGARCRYGLTSDQQPHSVEQVVRTLGVSRARGPPDRARRARAARRAARARGAARRRLTPVRLAGRLELRCSR